MAKTRKKSAESMGSVVDVLSAVKRALMRDGRFRKVGTSNKAGGGSSKNKPDLEAVAEMSHEILFKATTVFPFTLFPDTVTLDREKLSFATRYFYKVAQLTSIPVRDILSVEADVGPFFGSVRTSSRFFITNPKQVRWLWREDAVRLQRLLQGYVIVHEQDINCDKIKKDELVKMLYDLGTGRTG